MSDLTRFAANLTPGALTALSVGTELGDHASKGDTVNFALKLYADLLTAVGRNGLLTVTDDQGNAERWRLR